MAEVREVTVPDLGDFSEIPIIEILVSTGDTVAPEDPTDAPTERGGYSARDFALNDPRIALHYP